MNCGALVPPESLIPNYALRAAVEAFQQEGFLSHTACCGSIRQEQHERHDVAGWKIGMKATLAELNCSDDSDDYGFHQVGGQGTFSVNDHIIIKGNKDTPEHLFCQEAVITAKCLDGWYMVKTQDSEESVRLHHHSLQKVGGKDGTQAEEIVGTQAVLDVFTVRSKRSSLVTRASSVTRNGSLSPSGTYGKVYISGTRRRACSGNGTAYLSVIDNTREVSCPMPRETKDVKDLNFDGSNPGAIQMEVLHMIKKGMTNLEKEIPWICFQRMWRRQRSIWRKGLKESSTFQELSMRLQELRSSLLLSSAGGMPDEEWEKQLNTAKDSENIDLLICLWRNLNDDVSKWMMAKTNRSEVHLNKRIEADEYADLKKLFPTLIIEGFSPVGVTAAAAIAAAEAFSHDGSKNTEVLLKVPMKLIRQHNYHDLIVLREALEREKRHISAKLAVLNTKEFIKMNDFGESASSDNSMDKKPFYTKNYPHISGLNHVSSFA